MLNFYEYHSTSDLDNYDLYNEPLAFAINNNWFNWDNFDCKSIEHIIKKSPYEAYVYAYCIKDCRWPEAAIRECKEETGYDIKLLPVAPYVDLDPSNNTLVYTFRAEITGGKMLTGFQIEGKPKWVKIAELLRGSFPEYTKKMLKHFNISV